MQVHAFRVGVVALWSLVAALSPSAVFAGKVFFAQPLPGIPTTPVPITSTITATANDAYMPDGRLASDMVNGFGFNGSNFTFPGPTNSGLGPGTVTDPSTGYTIPSHVQGAFAEPTGWLSNAGNANNGFPVLTFDLGQVFNLDRLWLWNSPEGGRGATSLDISYSLTGLPGTYTQVADNYSLSLLDAQGDNIHDFDLNNIDARFIQLTDVRNGTGGHVGLGEIVFFESQFEPFPLTPEPSSIVLASVMGVMGGGWYWLKRRRVGA